MPGTNYQWLATQVTGTVDDLTTLLNSLEGRGYEIFTVAVQMVTNQHAWVVIARMEGPKQEKVSAPPEPAPTPAKVKPLPKVEKPAKVSRGGFP